jgi:hypothetical protein
LLSWSVSLSRTFRALSAPTSKESRSLWRYFSTPRPMLSLVFWSRKKSPLKPVER